MAILNKIRQRGLFLVIVIAMALFSFVLADLINKPGGLSTKSQEVIATVNGRDISREAFMNKVEVAQRNLGGRGTSTQAMNQVWDQEIRNAVMNSQYEALGIVVERDQMRDFLRLSLSSFEEFKDADGLYDENKLNEFIANLRDISPETGILNGTPIDYASWTNFETNLATGGIQQIYLNMVKAGVIGTLAEGELNYRMENDNVDVRFVQIPYTSIPDSMVTVRTSDINDYVNKNKRRYEVDETRDIRFVEFEEKASLEDEESIKTGFDRYIKGKIEYNDTILPFAEVSDHENYVDNVAGSALKFNPRFLRKSALPAANADSIFGLRPGEVFGPYKESTFYKLSKVVAETQLPDSVKVRHILIPFVGATRAGADVTKNMVEAKATADSIYNEISSGRSSFLSLLDLSSDKVSNENNGELEFNSLASMAPEFKNFSFENKVGDLEVVRTSFGYHIIEILNHYNPERALQVATIAIPIEPTEETIDKIFTETSKFEIAVTGGDFDAVAKENNYVVRPVSNVGVLDENIPGIGNQRALVRWAFEDDSEVGDIKRFSVQGGGYAVVMLSAINKEGLMTTEKASVTALPAIRKEKKAELIREQIVGATLDEIAANSGQTVKTAVALNMKTPTLSGAGREPKVIGAAFGLDEGELSQPIDGNFGVYVIVPTKVSPADPQPGYQAAANRLTTTRVNNVNSNLYNALKDASEIEDNRATFY
jgi:parvulin-like peptidyl-prolyl isomerase